MTRRSGAHHEQRPTALPPARTPDPREAPSLRWGVLGTGWIADKFVTALQKHSSQRIAAVGSRNIDSATEFARRFGIERAHGSYEELVSDPDVDVVYIATPHNAHLPHALLALQAGKHTLVEKPLALNADQGRGSPTRPAAAVCSAWRRTGPRSCRSSTSSASFSTPTLIGDVTAVVADFGEWFSRQPSHPSTGAGGWTDARSRDLSDQPRPRCRWTARPHHRIGHHDQYRRHGPNRHALEPSEISRPSCTPPSSPILRRRRLSPARRRRSTSTDRSTSRADSP